jgi:hypothetical protein
MKMAHERDMTFNELVEEALRSAIAGNLDPADVQKFIANRNWPA